MRKISLRRVLESKYFGPGVAFLAIFFFFSTFADKFLTATNWIVITARAAEIGIVTVGVAFLMISGEFDLSVGSVFALMPILWNKFGEAGLDLNLSFLVVFALASCIGLTNAAITLKTGIPSFITTLGMMMFLRGILLGFTGGYSIELHNKTLLAEALSRKWLGGFCFSLLWWIIISLIFSILLNYTRHGNWTLAVGGDINAARAIGTKVERTKAINFVLSSMLACFAGLIAFTRIGFVSPASGTGMELETIAASVIGGCSLSGGYGTIWGAFLGALIMALVANGLILLGVHPFWYSAFVGVIIIISAVININIMRVKLKI